MASSEIYARRLLNDAVVRDPGFHAAYCQLVRAHDSLYSAGYDHTSARLDAAESALRSATQLRPDSPDTHLSRAQHFYFAFRDYDRAQAELDIAGRGLPNDPRIPELTGYILRRQGKHEEALRALQHSMVLDPRNVSVLQQISASETNLRRYREAAATLDRALEIRPGDVAIGVIRAETDFDWHADPEPMCRFVEQVRIERPDSLIDVADNWVRCAIPKRDWAAAQQALAVLGDNPWWVDGPIQLHRKFGEGLVARWMNDEERAREKLNATRMAQEQVVQQQKDYAPALCVLALIDAALGNKQAALDEGRRAMALVPVTKDAFIGESLIANFALVATFVGEKELALEQLNTAVRLPTSSSPLTRYGVLKTYPFWDPIRGDPRFEAIVASLAPK